MTRALRPHQVRALDALRQSFIAGRRRPIIALPTGGGKTLLSASIVQGALSKGKRVVFCVPAISLIDQTVVEFHREGITDVGVIQADHPMTDYAKPVQVASVQTLSRRGWPDADLVIVDEAHRAHKIIFDWMQAKPGMLFVGLSATPWTKGLGKYYDDLIIAATTQELIDAGYLSQFRVFAPSHPDLSGVRVTAGDYNEADLSQVMDKPKLVADVVSTWLRMGEDRPTLCFGVDKAHAKSLQRQFEAAGVPTAYVDDQTSRLDREAIRKAFARGDIRVVCNIGVLTTGVDWDVRCIVLARPTKSEMLYVQIIGRGLRMADGKDDCLILDHSDTTLRLGFVTDIHHGTLNDGRMAKASERKAEQRAEPLPKECPKCTYLKPAKVQQCPACGFKPERQTNIECEAGELVQVKGKTKVFSQQDKQRFWSGLLYHAEDKGYSRGWCSHKFKEKFGTWPRGLLDLATAPAPDVRAWIIAGQIRYAKSRQAAERSGRAA